MAIPIFRLAHSFSHLHAPFKRARTLLKRNEALLQAEFSANAEKAAGAKTTLPVIQGNCNWHSACRGSSRALKRNERDLKSRKRFGWTDDDAKANWPHTAGAYRRIESANKGRRHERHARLERSKPGRP